MTQDLTWMDKAACSDLPTEKFFPNFERMTAELEAVCGRCPVKGTCLEYALARPKMRGIWGGTTTSQRVAIARLRRASEAA